MYECTGDSVIVVADNIHHLLLPLSQALQVLVIVALSWSYTYITLHYINISVNMICISASTSSTYVHRYVLYLDWFVLWTKVLCYVPRMVKVHRYESKKLISPMRRLLRCTFICPYISLNSKFRFTSCPVSSVLSEACEEVHGLVHTLIEYRQRCLY